MLLKELIDGIRRRHRLPHRLQSLFVPTALILVRMANIGPIERSLRQVAENREKRRILQQPQATEPSVEHGNAEGSASTAAPPISVDRSSRRRRTHSVSTIAQRRSVLMWMRQVVDREGDVAIVAKALKQFPQFFPGDYHSNYMKAHRWWKNRDQLMELSKEGRRTGNIASQGVHGVRRVNFKAVSGRGRKRAKWVAEIHNELLREYERVKSCGMKLSVSVLRTMALAIIQSAPEGSSFHESICFNGCNIRSKITYRWVQMFMQTKGLVIRAQTGKLSVSPEKQLYIEKSIAYHMGILKRGFESGELDEDLLSNADETHFIFNMDNGRTIGMRGDTNVKYADVTSGDEGITMMVHVSGGRFGKVEFPMLIFRNSGRSYPIRNVPDDVPGVCYRSQPKGWMDNELFSCWLSERRCVQADGLGRTRVIYVDNCSGHATSAKVQDACKAIKLDLRKLPKNATDLTQPADSFVIAKIKDAWTRRWEAYKAEMIQTGQWMGGNEGGSGKLCNPGKRFFLKLAAESVHEVNCMKDKDGLSYARKAMIRTGMSLNINGKWEESQLSSELQSIIAKYRSHFDGVQVD